MSYLVHTLTMPLMNVKYKLVTKRAFQPDAFKKLMKYVFDTFPESDAEKLIVSFIGELGRKYNRINHGFTCTDYDSAMCCWTSAMADIRNVTIDHHNGIFLIGEQKVERIFSDSTSINHFHGYIGNYFEMLAFCMFCMLACCVNTIQAAHI